MKLRLLAIGKLKAAFVRQGVAEFEKRLSRYLTFVVQELPAEEIPPRLSEAQMQKIMAAEAQTLLQASENCLRVALDRRGKMLSSEELAERLRAWQREGHKDIAFMIGGPLGLHDTVRSKAHLVLSLSPMTFLHEMTALILVEQLYRAQTILRGEPYHK